MARTLDADAIVVSENLTGRYDAFNFGFRENEQMYIGNSGAGLGWGVGAATGAKLAAPDRQVVCSIGDGSVMYSASGFWTQARYGIPVLTVVWNNQTIRPCVSPITHTRDAWPRAAIMPACTWAIPISISPSWPRARV